MGIFNPMYNEDTGWAAMDQLEPWQQALMNPSAGGAGYNTSPMQMGLIGQVNNQGSTLINPGGSNNFMGVPANDVSSFFGTVASGQPNGQPAAAPANTSPAVIASPSLATNMGMTGAENVGGVGMYTGSNGHLNTSLFAPQGTQAAMMNGSMGGLGQELYAAAQAGGLNPNTSYLQFIDDLSRRALAAKGGQGGLLPQDFVNYMQSQAGQQWFQGMRTPAASQPSIQQTGPANPPVAPLPPQQPQVDPPQMMQPYRQPQQQNPYMNPQQVRPPGSGANSYETGGSDPGNSLPLGNQRGELPAQWGNLPAQQRQQQQMINQLVQQGYSPQQAYAFAQEQSIPSLPGSQSFMQGYPGMNSGGGGYNPDYTQVYRQPNGNGGLLPGENRLGYDPYTGIYDPRRDPSSASWGQGLGGPTSYEEYLQQQSGSPFAVMPMGREQWTQAQAYSQNMANMSPADRMAAIAGMQGMGPTSQPTNPQWYASNMASPQNVQQRQQQPNWGDLSDYGRQQAGMPTAEQWRQMQQPSQFQDQSGQWLAGYNQQAQPQYGPQADYRAATFGSGTANQSGPASVTPPPANYSPTGGRAQGNNPWGNATNRLAGFGNGMSIFGNQFAGGSSAPRAPGTYGRAASYGQSQRPY